MAYSKADSYEIRMHDGKIRVPAVEQESNRLGYNDEVSVTLYPKTGDIVSLTFTSFLTSGSYVNVPVSIRNKLGLARFTDVEVGFESTGERYTPEVEATARKAVYESAHPAERNLEAVTDIVADD